MFEIDGGKGRHILRMEFHEEGMEQIIQETPFESEMYALSLYLKYQILLCTG